MGLSSDGLALMAALAACFSAVAAGTSAYVAFRAHRLSRELQRESSASALADRAVRIVGMADRLRRSADEAEKGLPTAFGATGNRLSTGFDRAKEELGRCRVRIDELEQRAQVVLAASSANLSRPDAQAREVELKSDLEALHNVGRVVDRRLELSREVHDRRRRKADATRGAQLFPGNDRGK